MSGAGVRSKVCVLLLTLPLLLFLTGCPFLFPASVLAGTWAFTVENAPDLNELLLTFNNTGRITKVTYQVTGGVEITVNNPSGTATVSGKNVTVQTTFNGNTLRFDGTLNSDDTVAQGTITLDIVVGGVTISIDGGAATMTKLLQ
jgi:hypothetical protein